MKLSSSDKKIIVLVLILAIVFGAYKLADMFSTENVELESEQRELSEKYSDLNSKNAIKNRYKADTETNIKELEELYNGFTTSVNQENIIMSLKMMENKTGIWFKEIAYQNQNIVYKFGDITSSNPSREGEDVYDSQDVGINTTISVSYECSYTQLKDVLTYFRENGKKTNITSMTFSYSQANDKVTGTMQITFFCITGPERLPVRPGIPDAAVGTGNVFASGTYVSDGIDTSYKDKIMTDYDMYVIMNQVGSDMNTVIVGQPGDPNNETAITSDKGTENVTIHVTGKEGQYKIKYSLDSSAYPEENYEDGAAFVFGKELDLLLISKPRTGTTDISEAKVKIINETDVVLNYTIINDDPDKPRIKVEEVGQIMSHN